MLYHPEHPKYLIQGIKLTIFIRQLIQVVCIVSHMDPEHFFASAAFDPVETLRGIFVCQVLILKLLWNLSSKTPSL